MKSPRFLLSNDDGFDAGGITALASRLRSVGEVWVIAPDREQSACSHSISLHKPLRVQQRGEREFTVDGTPTDCIYLGLHHLMPEPPDLVVSGINHGPNLGNDVLYSGTVSAAMEGALFGHRAVAVSLCVEGPSASLDFGTACEFAAGLALAVVDEPMPLGVLLNVNVPARPRNEIAGVKLCRLGYTDWADVVTVRKDPRGKLYYWIGGDRTGHDAIIDSDNNAVAQGYISITPIHYDITDYRSLSRARRLEVPGFAMAPDALGDESLPHPVHPRAKVKKEG